MRARGIREAGPEDAAAIAAIYRPYVEGSTATFEIDPPDAAEIALRIETLKSGGFPWLVAVTGDQVSGYAYAAPFRARAAFRTTVECSVYVSGSAQRQGIGRALLGALIEESEARGFRQMIAVIGDSSMQSASRGLHSSLGFAEAGRLPGVGFKQGRWLDVVLMQRALAGTP